MPREMSNERVVKGTMVIDIVKAIRILKDIPWDKYLSPSAKELVSQRIMPSFWYPYESVLSCLNALYKIVGKNKPELARAWGKQNGGKLFESVYRSIYIGHNGTTEALKKFEMIAKNSFWKNMIIESEEINPKHFVVKIKDNDPQTEPVYYFIQGWFDAIIEKTGGKNGKVNIIKKHWETGDETVMDVSWE